MRQDQFVNALKILRSIDHVEIPWMPDDDWTVFRDEPYLSFIRQDDESQAKIWEVIKRRNIGDEKAVRLCKDCRHFLPVSNKCGHPNAVSTNLVTGERRQFDASTERNYQTKDGCGFLGLNFEPKIEEPANAA